MIRWYDSRETPPPKDRRILMAYGFRIASGKYREGRMMEPQPPVIDWRCDCCGRFGKPSQWADYTDPQSTQGNGQ